MKFMGSKARIAKEIIPIITKERRKDQWYVEPFAGGLNSFQYVDGNRIASDNNKYLIAMWKGLRDGLSRPKTITREFYSNVRDSYRKEDGVYSDFMIGYVGFMASYNGRFFDGGYSGHCVGKTKRDYIGEQIRNTEKQIPFLKDAQFIHGNYWEIEYPPNSIIYCDPPYKGTKQYSTSKDFDHDKFWEWVRTMTLQGHAVYVSEYEAPEDFTSIWEKQVTNSMNQNNTYRPTENLFVYCPIDIRNSLFEMSVNIFSKTVGSDLAVVNPTMLPNPKYYKTL